MHSMVVTIIQCTVGVQVLLILYIRIEVHHDYRYDIQYLVCGDHIHMKGESKTHGIGVKCVFEKIQLEFMVQVHFFTHGDYY